MILTIQKGVAWENNFEILTTTDIQVNQRARNCLTFLGINHDTLIKVREASPYIMPLKNNIVEKIIEFINSSASRRSIIFPEKNYENKFVNCNIKCNTFE